MPRVCTVCAHGDIVAINQSLLSGESFRAIALRFALSVDALKRHKAGHISVTVAKAQEAAEVAVADDLLVQVRALRGKAMSLLLKAENAGDIRTALAGVREARACIELLMEVEGELDRRPVVNIITNPAWVELRTTLLQALLPFPEARVAVGAALNEVSYVA